MSRGDQLSESVAPLRLRCGVALRVDDEACQVVSEGVTFDAGFAPQFSRPRVERVSPGHLLALGTSPDGIDVIVWRWYDALVLGSDEDGVRLWEPAHGEVVARPRSARTRYEVGGRAYASAGLPGAEWWVAGVVSAGQAEVALDEVERLYTTNDLWSSVFGASGYPSK